jgi:hypothetical protein
LLTQEEEEEEDVIIDLEGEVDVALLGKGGCRGRGWQENGWPQVPVEIAQSRQRAKLFLQSSELRLPHAPLTRRRVCPHPLAQGWEAHALACGRGVGAVPIQTRGHTLWYSVYSI